MPRGSVYSRNKAEISIREASRAEAGLLTAIHRQCFTNYWNPDAFSDFFSVRHTYALLALAPEPAGMMVFRLQHEQADIITLCVLPPWRRGGIARKLLQAAIGKAKELGVKQMFLDVEDGNEAAFELYRQAGFTQINRRKLYYRQKDGSFTDALVMTRKL